MDFSQYSQAEQAQIAAMMEHKQVWSMEQLGGTSLLWIS
jgi:hypothetical protein